MDKFNTKVDKSTELKKQINSAKDFGRKYFSTLDNNWLRRYGTLTRGAAGSRISFPDKSMEIDNA